MRLLPFGALPEEWHLLSGPSSREHVCQMQNLSPPSDLASSLRQHTVMAGRARGDELVDDLASDAPNRSGHSMLLSKADYSESLRL